MTFISATYRPSVKSKTSNFTIISNVIPYVWSDSGLKGRVVISILLLILAKIAVVSTPLIFMLVVDSLAKSTEEKSDIFFLSLGATSLIIGFGTMRLLGIGFDQLKDALFAKVAQGALRSLALKTFRHIHLLSLRFHLEKKTGGLSRIVDRGVKGVEFLLRFLIFSIFPLIFELLLVSVILLQRFGFEYVLVVIIAIAIFIGFTFRTTEWRDKIRASMNLEDTKASQIAVESIVNYETIKYFSAEKREAVKYNTVMQNYEKAAIKSASSLAFLNFGQAFLITLGTVVVLVIASIDLQYGAISIGEFVGLNVIMMQLFMPLNFLGTVYREIRQALVDMGEMFDLLDHEIEIKDLPNSKNIDLSNGEILFKDVKFSYDPSRQILNKLNLKIDAGSVVAVVGASGSGKSTLARIICRFYDVSSGQILIDGTDIRHIKQVHLRDQIGVVPQDTILFNESIFYNIAYGKPEAKMAEIVNVAKASKLHDFIMTLERGYETIVGERGLKLSGGEKQRIGIARTILKDPPILIFDEATSSLDTKTEQEIQSSLNKISKGRTVLMIAHRLSTVVDADKILVMQNGAIVEEGSHKELISIKGMYASMWERQNR